ncbi:MAG: pseudouridine synthase [Vicingaceae bacterium]|nr:pseudouridine synthase [Vicingaceae bacterium]
MNKPKPTSPKKKPSTKDGAKATFKKKPFQKKDFTKKPVRKPNLPKADDGLTRLNKFLANAGICTRREADVLIKAGVVEVNGKVITEMGFKVSETDKVVYGGETIKNEQKVYVLMNKPKGFVASMNDPFNRRNVLELLGKLKQRVAPVDKMERDATGVLLLTNDDNLARRLTHPKLNVKKIYQVSTSTNVSALHLKQLTTGFELENGFAKIDVATYIGKGEDKRTIGVELTSTKSGVVKKMVEHLGYEVSKLDRVYFAGLTKKNLARGQWRILSEKEVGILKMSQKEVAE